MRAGISGNDSWAVGATLAEKMVSNQGVGCSLGAEPSRRDERWDDRGREHGWRGSNEPNPIRSDQLGTRNAGGGETRLDGELGTGTGALLGLYIYIADLLQWLRSTVRGGLNEAKMCFGEPGTRQVAGSSAGSSWISWLMAHGSWASGSQAKRPDKCAYCGE